MDFGVLSLTDMALALCKTWLVWISLFEGQDVKDQGSMS